MNFKSYLNWRSKAPNVDDLKKRKVKFLITSSVFSDDDDDDDDQHTASECASLPTDVIVESISSKNVENGIQEFVQPESSVTFTVPNASSSRKPAVPLDIFDAFTQSQPESPIRCVASRPPKVFITSTRSSSSCRPVAVPVNLDLVEKVTPVTRKPINKEFCEICFTRTSCDQDSHEFGVQAIAMKDAKNDMLRCSGCRSFVHRQCYNPVKRNWVNSKTFTCDGCLLGKKSKINALGGSACFLCSNHGGIMKQSTCGKTVHLLCVLYCAELTVDSATIEPNNLNSLEEKRKDLVCLGCKSRGGACVQCYFSTCQGVYHPFCAHKLNRLLVLRRSGVKEKNGIVESDSQSLDDSEASIDCTFDYELYCEDHIQYCKRSNIVSSNLELELKEKASPPAHPAALFNTQVLVDSDLKDYSRRSPIVSEPPPKVIFSKESKHKPSKRTDAEKKKIRSIVMGYFENEADHSTSDSSDEVEGSSDDSAEQSDSFINDGEYTQFSQESESITHLRVNNEAFLSYELESPGFGFRGSSACKSVLKRLVEREENGGCSETDISLNEILDESFATTNGSETGQFYLTGNTDGAEAEIRKMTQKESNRTRTTADKTRLVASVISPIEAREEITKRPALDILEPKQKWLRTASSLLLEEEEW